MMVVPITLREANAYVKQHHRHLANARGCRFCVGVEVEGQLVGVAIVGRPSARLLDDGRTAEVVRVATDGTPNACSALYGATRAAARAMGFRRIVTYTLATEPGTSLRAAGWVRDVETTGGEWSRPSRQRGAAAQPGAKVRWSVTFGRAA